LKDNFETNISEDVN